MTTYDEPPAELEPDDELDRQAAAEGLTTRHPNHHHTPNGAPHHDTDAEQAALGSMLDSLEAAATIIDTGLNGTDFYSPRNGRIYDAICTVIANGHRPEPFTVADTCPDPTVTIPDLVNLTLGHHLHYNAKAYAQRILTAAHARTLQGHALEVAAAAQAGQLDEAIRLTTKLTDHIPTGTTDTTWAPLDLTAILDGDTTAPEPDLLHVNGAPALFYSGRTNLIFGESGAGKTWLALAAVAELVLAGRHVIYIDLEDTPAGLIARLLLLGLTRTQIATCVHYVQPDVAWTPTAQATIAAVIDRNDAALVVLDSTGEAMAADGVKGNDDDDVARWFTAGPRFIARRGPAVIVIDHIPKDNQHAPLDPIGSQRKKAAIDGASYRIDSPKPPSIAHDGLLVAVCSKDRHGHHTRGQKAASIAVTHGTGDTVVLTLSAPDKTPVDAAGNFRPTALMERVSETLAAHPGLSQERIVSLTTGKAKHLREALGQLVREGYVEFDPTPGRFAYRNVKPFPDPEPAPTDNDNHGDSHDL